MAYETLLVNQQKGVLSVKLNRPQVLNALDVKCFSELEECFMAAQSDSDIRVVILSGEGRAFSSGGDMSLLKMLSEASTFEVRRIVFGIHHQMKAVAGIEKPVIVAINGPAIGAGLNLALLGDIRLAAEEAVMSVEFVRVGIIPELGGTLLLSRIIGYGRAVELALTARRINAVEAKEMGLVTRVVPAAELEDTALRLARELASLPPIALALAKRAVRKATVGDLDAVFENECTYNSICFGTEDHREAVAAFLAKRAPNFSGR